MTPNLIVLTGDCRQTLRTLPPQHFHCVVTSPPYWGLRDYQNDPIIFGGDPRCDHQWTPCGVRGAKPDRSNQGHDANGSGVFSEVLARGSQGFKAACGSQLLFGDSCPCGAWRGQLGLETTIAMYCQHMVEIFREVWRVLRDDGVLWVNLGDTYNAASNCPRQTTKTAKHGYWQNPMVDHRNNVAGLKPKDLVGIPWRVAFALQDAGWYLRQDIIWHKPNPMPESINDRCTKAHEYIFLLAKSEDYFFDHWAIQEPVSGTAHSRGSGVNAKIKVPSGWDTGDGSHNNLNGRYKVKQNESYSSAISGPLRAMRNRRSVWTITTQAFRGAHFATFPEKLVEPCIKAGTSEHGCCPRCGAPWGRIVEMQDTGVKAGDEGEEIPMTYKAPVTTGWKPGCRCSSAAELRTSTNPDRLFDTVLTPPDPVPCRVLDPFGGSGRTAKVALRLGRASTMCELNPQYVDLIHKQCTPTK